MAFFSKAGKTSGVCRDCNTLTNKAGECACTSGSGHATCSGCGANGFVPNKNADESEIRGKIGCICS